MFSLRCVLWAGTLIFRPQCMDFLLQCKGAHTGLLATWVARFLLGSQGQAAGWQGRLLFTECQLLGRSFSCISWLKSPTSHRQRGKREGTHQIQMERTSARPLLYSCYVKAMRGREEACWSFPCTLQHSIQQTDLNLLHTSLASLLKLGLGLNPVFFLCAHHGEL